MSTRELPVIQKVHDLILWFIPILNRFPVTHRHGIGQRAILEKSPPQEEVSLSLLLDPQPAWSLTFDWQSHEPVPSLTGLR